MTYYPKNKILTNQVATRYVDPKGKRLGTTYWVYEDSLDIYEGSYYKLYTGEMYTGKFPGDGVNKKIIKIEGESTSESLEHSEGKAPRPSNNITSNVFPLFPTEQDYKNGIFNRYFSKKRNEYLFEELTKAQYDQLNNPSSLRFTLYQPFFIKWMLTGEKQTVTDYNFYSIRNAEEKEGVLGLNEFLKMDYTKYYK